MKQKKAIIIAGSGPYQNNALWDSTRRCCNMAYLSLLTQGFEPDAIYYISNINTEFVASDGFNDVDGLASPYEVQEAIRWAEDASELILFMTGHGGEDTFRLNPENEVLTAQQLDGWLDTLQQRMTGNLALIYDGCQSGSFIDNLAPPAGRKRLVATSSGSQEKAWFQHDGSGSFSYQFWAAAQLKGKLSEAFITAKNMVSGSQTPWLESDFDYDNYDKDDQREASSFTIGRGRVAASEPPVLGAVTDDTVFDASAVLTLWAKNIFGLNSIQQVWAVIVPPFVANLPAETPVTDDLLVRIELTDSDQDGTYEGNYLFSEKGTYNVSIHAMDNQQMQAVPKNITVSVNTDVDVGARFNQSRYRPGDRLKFSADISSAKGAFDLYAAIIVPGGTFFTIRHPFAFSAPYEIVPFLTNIPLTGTVTIIDITTPAGIAGTYTGYIIATEPGADASNMQNWIDSDCKSVTIR